MENNRLEKSTLHLRNKHRKGYDFAALITSSPALAPFIIVNKFGNESINFANPDAVKALNRALLQRYYHIKFWDIPAGYLCPPIPGRADYLHNAADLLASFNHHQIPTGKKIKVLDIGVGANCVYPIIGHSEYGWSFVGADIDVLAIRAAQNIVAANAELSNAIEIRKQSNPSDIFRGIIHQEEYFDLIICNPPFHASVGEARSGSQRKARNLGQKNSSDPVLNFGGQSTELWTPGGEVAFIEKMIVESKFFQRQCFWFTSLVSKSENLAAIYGILERTGVRQVRTSEMATGNKISRVVGWSYFDEIQTADWVKRW